MRFASRLFLLALPLLGGCAELQREFQGPARLELAGVKAGACATVKVAGQASTRCDSYTFRFTGLSGRYPVEVLVEWQGLQVQGYRGEVDLAPGATARVEVERSTLTLEVEATWAGSGAQYEAWVPADYAFGVSAYPDPAPGGLEGMVLVYRGGRTLRVPTAPRAVVRVLDGAAEARAVVENPTDGMGVRVPEPTYAPIVLTSSGLVGGVSCVAAYLGSLEAVRSCTPPFSLRLTPPDGQSREVVLRAYRDGFAYQEGRVVARSGDSLQVPMSRKRVAVVLTAPGLTVDQTAYGEVWLRPEDQEGVALYGDPSPDGFPGYRLADRALVVNGEAALSVPTGRFVLFRVVQTGGARQGVVDLVEEERKVVVP
jgi:hypothetical protein